jgi:hypothetical protein
MKKLSKIKEFLSREEMKQVQGGSGGGGCIGVGSFCVTHSSPMTCCTGSYCKGGLGGSHWGLCKHNC